MSAGSISFNMWFAWCVPILGLGNLKMHFCVWGAGGGGGGLLTVETCGLGLLEVFSILTRWFALGNERVCGGVEVASWILFEWNTLHLGSFFLGTTSVEMSALLVMFCVC